MFAAQFCSFWDEFFNIPPAKIMQPDDTSGLRVCRLAAVRDAKGRRAADTLTAYLNLTHGRFAVT